MARRDKLNIGQRVIWATGKAEYAATVLSQREPLSYRGTGRRTLVYRVEVDGFGRSQDGFIFAAPEPELRPLYDGDQPSSWSECAWQPKAITAGRGRG